MEDPVGVTDSVRSRELGPEIVLDAIGRVVDDAEEIPRAAHQHPRRRRALTRLAEEPLEVREPALAVVGIVAFQATRRGEIDLVVTELLGELRWVGERLPRGCEHAADDESVHRPEGIRRRHADDADLLARPTRDVPKRRRPEVGRARQASRLVPPGREPPEGEDPVRARVPAGHEGGPGRQGERRDRRAECTPGAAIHQSGERGHATHPRPGLEKAPRGPVEPDDEDPAHDAESGPYPTGPGGTS